MVIFMKTLVLALTLPFLAVSAPVDAASPKAAFSGIFAPEVTFHGGGCRKSSPPGQCCHMQKSSGQVHCH